MNHLVERFDRLNLLTIFLTASHFIININGLQSSIQIPFRNNLVATSRYLLSASVPKEFPGIKVSTDLDIIRFLGKIDWAIDKPQASKSGVEDDVFERYFVDNERRASITTVRIYEGRFAVPFDDLNKSNDNNNDAYSFSDIEPLDEIDEIDGLGTIIRRSARKRKNEVRCFMKEFLPNAKLFGQNEIAVTKKLTRVWNSYQNESSHLEDDSSISSTAKKRKKTPLFKNDYPPFPILLAHGFCDKGTNSASFRGKFRSRFPRMKLPEVLLHFI